jgi:hypothetical protein
MGFMDKFSNKIDTNYFTGMFGMVIGLWIPSPIYEIVEEDMERKNKSDLESNGDVKDVEYR